MFSNRKERGELLEGLIVSNKDPTVPNFSQVIYLSRTHFGRRLPRSTYVYIVYPCRKCIFYGVRMIRFSIWSLLRTCKGKFDNSYIHIVFNIILINEINHDKVAPI
jgi:hypothetical protein